MIFALIRNVFVASPQTLMTGFGGANSSKSSWRWTGIITCFCSFILMRKKHVSFASMVSKCFKWILIAISTYIYWSELLFTFYGGLDFIVYVFAGWTCLKVKTRDVSTFFTLNVFVWFDFKYFWDYISFVDAINFCFCAFSWKFFLETHHHR